MLLALNGSKGPKLQSSTVKLACEVSGYHVILQNQGDAAIAAGTEVGWSVRFARMEGSHTLDSDLEPDGRIFLSAALGSSFLEPGVPCVISEGSDDATTPLPGG